MLLRSILVSTILFTASFALGNAQFKPEVIPHFPMSVFAPNGFDSNDNTQLVFEGYFSSSCYKTGLTFFNVDRVNRVIEVEDTSHYYDAQFCLDVIVPYVKELNIGVLDPGKYTVMFKKSDGRFEKTVEMPIYVAKGNMPDQHLYAPINDAVFSPKKGENPNELTLKGTFPNNCMVIDRVEVLDQKAEKVVAIQPIARIAGNNCQVMEKEFEYKVSLDSVSKGRRLIHVRSLNGAAVNRLVNIK